MSKTIIENAKIESLNLGIANRGILTMTIALSGEGWGQCYGSYRMDGENAFLAESITTILNVLKLENIEEIKGTIVRIKKEEGWGGKILAIGNILEEKWFNFEEIKTKLKL